MGGSRDAETNSPSNLLTLDRDCHMHIEANRAESAELGYLVAQGSSPSLRPVRHRLYGWVFLNDDGSTRPVSTASVSSRSRPGFAWEPRIIPDTTDRNGAA
jgi:hypothetical protein